ncbi:MAG: hypothetical protein MUC62_08230 [Candidatus Thermoplasmatota archaeon]|nr:hypothetical protein [Candidatus Thermoplasmatota archaeon]
MSNRMVLAGLSVSVLLASLAVAVAATDLLAEDPAGTGTSDVEENTQIDGTEDLTNSTTVPPEPKNGTGRPHRHHPYGNATWEPRGPRDDMNCTHDRNRTGPDNGTMMPRPPTQGHRPGMGGPHGPMLDGNMTAPRENDNGTFGQGTGSWNFIVIFPGSGAQFNWTVGTDWSSFLENLTADGCNGMMIIIFR